MRIVIITGKLAASGAIVAGALAFVFFLGPRTTPAYADIYAPLANAAGFLSPPGGGSSVRISKALVNGQAFQYSIGHSRLNLDDVLMHYERQFEMIGPASGKSISTAARVQGRAAGVVVGVRLGPLTHPGDITERLQKFRSTTQMKALGQFHVISAYAQQGTVYIDLTPSDDIRLGTLLPTGTDDAPGEDLQGVVRPLGLQRLLTIEHGEGPTWSRTLIYRASNPDDATADFGRAFAAGGWSRNTLVDSPVVSHYTDGRRECFLGGSGLDKNGIVILVYRALAGSPKKS